MCGRFLFDAEFDELYHRLMGRERDIRRFKGDYKPAHAAPVLIEKSQAEIDFQYMQWGLLNPVNKGLIINARSETLKDKALFRPLLSQRCIIPANQFYETETRGKEKIPHRFGCDQQLFLAGLYDFDKNTNEGRFTIITKASEGIIRQYHDRMPVHVDPDLIGTWLRASPEEALLCLKHQQPDYVLLDEVIQLSFF